MEKYLIDNIHYLLEKNNMKKEQLANKMGYSGVATLNWYLNGKEIPTAELRKLERIFLIPDHILKTRDVREIKIYGREYFKRLNEKMVNLNLKNLEKTVNYIDELLDMEKK